MRSMLMIMTMTMALTVVAEAQQTETVVCKAQCGSVPVRYPLGSGPGCGDPRFEKYVRCQDNNKLVLTTQLGSYQITSVDYQNNVVLIRDPLMSTCSSMQNSGSFGLDQSAPFKIKEDVFVLLGCSSSSPLFDSSNPLCDTGSSHICTALYSCPAVSGLGLSQNAPISSCCVYSPINLGPADQLNLPKLQCSSYSSIYSFGNNPTDPKRWKYGIALKYSYNSASGSITYFASACNLCQQSAGMCGYTGVTNSFVCLCKNGVNTTTNCYGQGPPLSYLSGMEPGTSKSHKFSLPDANRRSNHPATVTFSLKLKGC